ncbi:MAG: ABC transporter permease subunit [Hahellaceae bacterium]|nr:ABC transporter permease subunit [Hahellaceae bacterium]
MQSSVGKAPQLEFDTPRLRRHRQLRALKDRVARHAIAAGGLSVIVAVTLIFFYLLYEVFPLFRASSVEPLATYDRPGAAESVTRLLAIEEQGEKGMRLTARGLVYFFDVKNGVVESSVTLPVPEGAEVTAVAEGALGSRKVAVGFSSGEILMLQHDYRVTFPVGQQRLITPSVVYPQGETPIRLAPEGVALTSVALSDGDDNLMYVAVGSDGKLYGKRFEKEENFLSGEVTMEEVALALPASDAEIESIALSPNGRFLYLVQATGTIDMHDLSKPDKPALVDTVAAVTAGETITDLRFLLGGYALLVATDKGRVIQFFPVRDENNRFALEKIREFDSGSGDVVTLAMEERRKGFITASSDGAVAAFNTTAHNRALQEGLSDQPILRTALAPRANFLLVETADLKLHLVAVHNEHPDVSFSALWDKVWYEGYDKPDYIWQSSAANNDFEPKYSLMPLVFGTLKAAFYAMLLAVPLAICGAIYAAHFMAPAVRRKVKPAIELMEAIPTVILGFLAGLFFAPFMEENLPGVFAVLLIVPVGVVAFAFAWANAPKPLTQWVPDGWDAVVLIPVIVFLGWISFAISGYLEIWFFGGDMRLWLTRDMGIDYSQRNSLVIGVAMGIAVIPTIFSIAEDAIFSVPKHLMFGSLALGATPWQTMIRVILPTASPGIFSALMIGLGRAVGETMIVLMATGNTAIMDMNIFEGMRTLSANIAVEMPESEVGSSHFRILFLAGFVLFVFTFFVNTLAEYVRQRLRKKYSVI